MARVEKVVKAPRKPTDTAVVVVGDQRPAPGPPSTNPRRNEPSTLMASVAHGKDRTPIAVPIQ